MTNKKYISASMFEEYTDRMAEMLKKYMHDNYRIVSKIYGVPRGGVPIAVRLSKLMNWPLTDTIDEHTLVVDDIIDSGATASKYPDNLFFAMFDKYEILEDMPNVISWYTRPFCDDEGNVPWIEFFWEKTEQDDHDLIARLIERIGDDPTREGLKETPDRVVRSWAELFSGYVTEPESVFKTFEEKDTGDLVILDNIEFFSTCEHHLLPFYGRAHIAYIPDGKVIGISKLARLLEVYSRRLQVQERIGHQVTEALMKHLNPLGAACIIEAKHHCMCSRGVNKQHSVMRTSSLKGVFMEKDAARLELLSLIGRNND